MIKIIRKSLWATLGVLILTGCGPIQSSKPCPMTPLVETSGWDLQKIDEAFRFACEMGTTTLVIVADGKVVRSLGDIAVPYQAHSVRKALLSALIGQHAGTGPNQIKMESTLAELGIDDDPHPLKDLQEETKVLHLIKSISGINHLAAAEGGLMQKDKDRLLGKEPNIAGTKWAYNNWD